MTVPVNICIILFTEIWEFYFFSLSHFLNHKLISSYFYIRKFGSFNFLSLSLSWMIICFLQLLICFIMSRDDIFIFFVIQLSEYPIYCSCQYVHLYYFMFGNENKLNWTLSLNHNFIVSSKFVSDLTFYDLIYDLISRNHIYYLISWIVILTKAIQTYSQTRRKTQIQNSENYLIPRKKKLF